MRAQGSDLRALSPHQSKGDGCTDVRSKFSLLHRTSVPSGAAVQKEKEGKRKRAREGERERGREKEREPERERAKKREREREKEREPERERG